MGRDLGSEFPPLERRQANTLIRYHNGHIILPVKQPSRNNQGNAVCVSFDNVDLRRGRADGAQH